MGIIDIWSDVKKRVQGYINPWKDEYEGKIPVSGFSSDGVMDEKKADDVAHYAEGLFTDAKNYFESEFERTKSYRFNTGKAGTYWDNNLKIEAGMPWDVWGHRKDTGRNKWKEELSDPITSYNLRARIAYLTANWHDVQISPNVQDMNDVLLQERKATRWGERITDIVKHMGIFGEAWTISFLDKDHPYGGIATEFLCRPGSVLLTPFATGKFKDEGCWCAIHADMVSGQWVEETFPKFDMKQSSPADTNILAYATSEAAKKQSVGYSHTKLYDKVEVWMDDPELETVPFEQEEFDQRVGKLAETFQGVAEEPVPGMEEEKVEPLPTDNHKRWVKAYYDYLEEKADFVKGLSDKGESEEEDEVLLGELKKLIFEQVDAHEKMAAALPYGGSKIRKYPYGRHIIKIGGRLAMDQPFEYEADWRKFLHKVYNEKVPLRLDGRSDVEIQRPTQLVLDTMLSRFADFELLHALKKPYFPVSEKATILADGFTHDPTEPGFTNTGEPPRYEQSSEPTGLLRMVELYKGIGDKNVGVSEVTFGKSAPQESGKKVDTLLAQSEMVVTGEGNKNLQGYVEEVIEARLLIMRQFYVEPRPYTVGGAQVMLSVSGMLKNIQVENRVTGEVEMVEYPQFEISVRPDSNAPYKWERELNQLQGLLQAMPPDVQPAFMKLIIDLLSERYPQLKNELMQFNQDANMGASIREQQQKRLDERKAMLEGVAKKRSRKQAEESLAKSGNGNGVPQGAMA